MKEGKIEKKENLEKKENTKEQEKEALKEKILKIAERLGISIINIDNIDQFLGDKPYLSHAIVSNPEKLLDILESEELQSSKKSGKGAMTYEFDKLMGMDQNVFFALGKGYMREDRYGLLFDIEKISNLPEASFVEDDFMNIGQGIVTEFLDKHKSEIIDVIETKREYLKKQFEEKVKSAFEGGYGIYGKYFTNPSFEIVDDFLTAIKTKGFKGINSEKEVIDQFTILSDTILSAEVMPEDLRNKLVDLLEEKVIQKYTISGAENIKKVINEDWRENKDDYTSFLSGETMVPEKVAEIRIPDQVKFEDSIIGIFVPK